MILGAVLAGGRATRFGSDKAAAVWRGEPLLEHVARRLAAVAAKVVIVGRDHPGKGCIPDRPTPGLGPLGGLNAALHFAAGRGFDVVITLPCDVPSIEPELLDRLARADGNAFLIDMPVIGRWLAAEAPLLDRHLAAGGSRSMRSWTTLLGATPLSFAAPANINQVDDLLGLASSTTAKEAD